MWQPCRPAPALSLPPAPSLPFSRPLPGAEPCPPSLQVFQDSSRYLTADLWSLAPRHWGLCFHLVLRPLSTLCEGSAARGKHLAHVRSSALAHRCTAPICTDTSFDTQSQLLFFQEAPQATSVPLLPLLPEDLCPPTNACLVFALWEDSEKMHYDSFRFHLPTPGNY